MRARVKVRVDDAALHGWSDGQGDSSVTIDVIDTILGIILYDENQAA